MYFTCRAAIEIRKSTVKICNFVKKSNFFWFALHELERMQINVSSLHIWDISRLQISFNSSSQSWGVQLLSRIGRMLDMLLTDQPCSLSQLTHCILIKEVIFRLHIIELFHCWIEHLGKTFYKSGKFDYRCGLFSL